MPIPKAVSEQTIEGRKFIRYEHDSEAGWGYTKMQKDYFHFAPARSGLKNAPLRVILHSAGCSGDIAVDRAHKHPEWFHYYASQDYHVLYPDCRKNRAKDWWWGSEEIKRSPGK